MTKKKDDVQENVNLDADRPVKPDNKFGDAGVLSHNWQENSPAVDLSYQGSENAVNAVAVQKAAEELAKNPPEEEKKKPISQAEYDRRTKLDVSDKDFINPSLDHWDVK